MTVRTFSVLAAMLVPATMLADFSYEQTTKMTGGALAGMMKVAGAFSRQAREPVRTTVAVKGNRMSHLSEHNTSVIDLDSETITDINHDRKTYSVMTFAEMAQAMQEAMAQMKDAKTEADFKVSVKETGKTKIIGGLDAKEFILTFDVEAKDQKSGQSGAMQMTSDVWLAPSVPGYKEVQDFYLRMSQKMAWSPGGMAAGAQFGRGMAAAAKEISKMNGVPVLQVMRFTAPGTEEAMAQAARDAERQQAQPKEAEKPSAGSALGGALGGRLGGRLGGLGGFGRKKKQPQEEEQPKAETKQEAAPAPAPETAQASGALMEMTTELTAFSSSAVDAAKLAVPAGYKKVESDLMKRRR